MIRTPHNNNSKGVGGVGASCENHPFILAVGKNGKTYEDWIDKVWRNKNNNSKKNNKNYKNRKKDYHKKIVGSRKRSVRKKNILFIILTIFLLVFAIKGMVVIKNYLGYASFAGEAGTITEMEIKHIIPTYSWAGVYGVAVRVDGYYNQQYEDLVARSMEEDNLLFNCLEPDIEHEVYASTTPPDQLDLSALYSVDPSYVDQINGKNSSDFDSAVNTYKSLYTLKFGTQEVTAYATYTYAAGEDDPNTFVTGILQDSQHHIIYFAILTNFTEGFNGRIFNYQLLLPADADPQRYYFFTDPNDQCPEGEGENPNPGVVYGTVSSTTGVPIENVIVTVGPVSAITDANGFYNITVPAGNYFIFAVKEGYKVYHNNITVISDESVEHNIILELESVENQFTGLGPGEDAPGDNVDIGPATQTGVGPGQDQGPGEVPPMPVTENPEVIEGKDYIVSLAELKRKLRIDQFVQEKIQIYSLKKVKGSVTLTINGSDELKNIISVDKKSLEIEPNDMGEFVLTLFGRGKLGTYNGTIILGGDFNATIPVEIELLPKNRMPVQALQIDLELAEKSLYPGDLVRFKTDMRNLITDQSYPVELFFTVQDPEGKETLWSYSTRVFIKTAFSLIKNFKVKPDVKPGDYILRVTAKYLDFSSSTSTIFHVNVPFWQRSFLGLKNWIWFLIIAFISSAVLAGYLIYRNIQSKKKYHLKVDYNELPKPGPRSIFVGKIAETEKKTYFNLEQFKVHTIVAGSTGGGKSVSAQVIIEEALDKGVAVVVFDPTAQWTGMLRPCKDKTMLSLYPLFDMKKSDAKAYNGNIRMITDAREYIDIKKFVKPGEIQVFCFHKLDPKDMDIVVANAIRSIFRSGPKESKLLKVLFVFDEVHRLLPKFGGSGDGFLQIERACREFRKWGMGVVLISQVLSDFVGTIKANINTEVQMRTRDEGDLERIRQKYGEDVLRSLVKATVGTGMVENPSYNRGQPYFVAFRPLKHSVERLTDEEIEKYNEFNERIDNLFYSLEQLEEEGVDVFDLKLELKLALDKVKTGNFNMVDIYLEGLIPRIDKQWEKLGKKPKQLEKQLVDMSELQAELEKAKQERDKYLAQQQKDKPQSESGDDKGDIYKRDVSPDKILNLKNGMIVINLASLYDEIAAMKDDDLVKEFDPDNHLNRFADWVKSAVGEENLANHLYNAKSKDELLAVLEKVKNGEKLEKVSPPDWVTNSGSANNKSNSSNNDISNNNGSNNDSSDNNKGTSGTNDLDSAGANGNGVDSDGGNNNVDGDKSGAVPDRKPVEDIVEEHNKMNNKEENNNTNNQTNQANQDNRPGKSSLESMVVSNPEEAFKLENGMTINSVKELKEYLPRMDDSLFKNHVGDNYNHFADWIKGVFHNEELASKISAAHSKDEMMRILDAYA